MEYSPLKFRVAAVFVAAGLSAYAIPPVPRPAKDFTVVEASGKETHIASLKGKVVVLEFLFTTCPHCQNASRMFTKLQRELGPKGFQALGVAIDNANAAKAAQFVQQFGV